MKSEVHQYDFVVIGGGSAGYAAANQASSLGLQVAVIEGGEEVAGLCILRGCMPSKTLLESGHRAEDIRRAAEFGLKAEYHGWDGEKIRDRKRFLIADFAGYRREQLENGPFVFWRGLAKFTGPHSLEVELHDGSGRVQIEAKAFLIATGSRIKRVAIEGLEETGFWTSDDVLDSTAQPHSVIVLGAGPTGLELASYYAGLGARVTIIQRGAHLLRGADEDVAEAVADGLRKRGIEVHVGTKILRAEPGEAGQKRIFFEKDGFENVAEAQEIVYSLGREPQADGLALEKAGLPLEKWKGVHAGPTQQTRVPHIFAAGDVCGPYEVVHIAIQQAELAACNAARLLGLKPGPLQEMDYTLKLFAVFCHPEVAYAGLTEREATQLEISFIEAKYPFADHGKAMIHGETEGFVKLLAAGPDRKIIGGAVVGPQASEMIHEVVVAMRFGATAEQFAAIPHYHPTLSEIWTYPAEALAKC